MERGGGIEIEAGIRIVCDLCFAFVTFPHLDTFGTSDFNPFTERKRGQQLSPPFIRCSLCGVGEGVAMLESVTVGRGG
jgi:hypothetical protein